MTRFNTIISLFLIFVLLSLCSANAAVPSDYDTATPQILETGHLYGQSCILINADTGDVLFEKDADARRYPASTTKIMTCILGIEWAYEHGGLDNWITIPGNIGVSSDSSKMGLTAGDRMSMRDLLYGMMLASGNDAALAVAYIVADSPAEFVKLMNRKAEEIGLSSKNTNFTNPHGLHEVNHYTTARDLASITMYCMQNEDFRAIVGCTEHTVTSDYWPDGKVFTTKYDLMLDTNVLYYEPCIGVKTGFTKAAGRSFVGAAEKGGITLIAVSLNPIKIDEADKSYVEAFTDNIRMFKYGFLKYESLSFKEMCDRCDDSLLSVKVNRASKNDIGGGYLEIGVTDIPASYTEGYLKSDLEDPETLDRITRDFSGRIRIELTSGELYAPLSAGDVIGKAYFTGVDGAVYEGSVIATRDVDEEPATMDEIMDEWLSEHPFIKKLSPKYNSAAWLLYAVLIALIVIGVYYAGAKKRRRNRARKAAYERKKREYLRRMQREEYLRKHPSAAKAPASKSTSVKPRSSKK